MIAVNQESANRLDARNQEIGQRLLTAREQQRRSVRECASLLGTSRRRYAAIERGETWFSFQTIRNLTHY